MAVILGSDLAPIDEVQSLGWLIDVACGWQGKHEREQRGEEWAQ